MPLARSLLLAVALLAASSATANQQVTLQLKWKHQYQFAGYYAAVEKGYYNDVGLDVALVEAQPEYQNVERVISGEAEFGVAASELILLRGEGHPVVALAPIFQHSPYIFLVTADSGIGSVHELKGKRIGYEPHASELLAYLQFEGIAPWQVTLQELDFDPLCLVRGEADALASYSTDQPFLLEQHGIQYLTFTPRAGGIDFYGDTLFTSERLLRRDPDLVKRFLAASLRGWRYALDHPEEVVDLILDRYSDRHSREHLLYEAKMTRRLIVPDVVELGYLNPGRWQHIADTYVRMGMLDPDYDLTGFLYDPNPPRTAAWVYLGFVAIGMATAFLGMGIVNYWKLTRKVAEQASSLQQVTEEATVLRSLLPICSNCKKVRDDEGFWQNVETYLVLHADTELTHGICPDCLHELYPAQAAIVLGEVEPQSEDPGASPPPDATTPPASEEPR